VGFFSLNRIAIQGFSRTSFKRFRRRKMRKHQPPMVMNEAFVAIIIGLFFFASLGTVRAVQRPPYPVKAEKPGAGGWLIIGTNEKTR